MIATEIPIKVYNSVHAGPKTHDGGWKKGLFNAPSNSKKQKFFWNQIWKYPRNKPTFALPF